MAWDGAPVAVQPVLPEPLGRHLDESVLHVRSLVVRRIDAVGTPDHHRRGAPLALGDPAHVVLVEPRRDPRRLAQLTVLVESTLILHAA